MSSDNRRFLRVPACGESRAAVLRYDGKTLACEMVNESSGGFGVAVPASYASALAPGRLVVFQLDDLSVQVQIAHAKLEDDQLVIGLERIEDLADGSDGKQSASRSSSLVRDICIAVSLASILLVWLFLPSAIEMAQGKKKRPRTAAPPTLNWPKALLPASRP